MYYYDIQHATNAIAYCVVLHNIFEQLGGACQPDWIYTDSEAPVAPAAMTTRVGSNASTICNALKQYVYDNHYLLLPLLCIYSASC